MPYESNQNPFDLRRYAGILGGGQQPDPLMKAYRGVNFNQPQQQVEQPQQQQQAEDPFLAAMGRLNQGQAAGAYRKHLTDMPDPAAYAPSKWRQLGAALTAGAASFGRDPQNAMALGSEVRDAPLKSAVNTWQLKGAGLKEQADIEAQDVKGQMEQIKQIREYIKQQNDQEITKANTESQIRLRDAQIANFESQGWTQSVRPDGNLWMVKPGQEPQNMGPSMEGRKQDWNEKYQGGQQQIAEGKLKDDERRTGIMGQNAQTYANTANNRAGGVVDANENFQTEALATREVLRQKPEYQGWVNSNGTIKGPNDYWFGGSMPNPANDKGYADFLARVAAAKQQIYGTRRGAPGGVVTPGGAVTPPGPIRFDDLPDE